MGATNSNSPLFAAVLALLSSVPVLSFAQTSDSSVEISVQRRASESLEIVDAPIPAERASRPEYQIAQAVSPVVRPVDRPTASNTSRSTTSVTLPSSLFAPTDPAERSLGEREEFSDQLRHVLGFLLHVSQEDSSPNWFHCVHRAALLQCTVAERGHTFLIWPFFAITAFC